MRVTKEYATRNNNNNNSDAGEYYNNRVRYYLTTRGWGEL